MLEELGAPFRENGIATIVSVVGAGRRGYIAFGVVWPGVMEALARVFRPRVREVHRYARLPIQGEVRSLLPELGGLATSYGRNSIEDFPSFSESQGGSCSYSPGC